MDVPDHPLDGARERVKRTDKYLNELITLLEEAAREYQDSFVFEHDEVSNRESVRIPIPKPIPWDIPFAVGDFIHNLRIALDYMVFELSKKVSGDPDPKGTQFPLCTDSSQFDNIRKARAKGKGPLAYVTSAHVDAIEAYQPYKGVKWTEILRVVSNEDKHRDVTLIRGRRALHITDGIGEVFQGIGANRSDIKLERKVTVTIALFNGDPVIETLEILKREVSLVINSFSSEF